jgi:death-on-curing protein
MFLSMNGFMGIVGSFFFRMEAISLHVAAGNIDKELLHEIITSILYEADYNETLKLKILDAFSKNKVDTDE